MKVLFLDHPEACYLEAPLYLGFCQLFGAENVIDYPWKNSYHGEVHRYPNLYPTRPDQPEGEQGCTAPFPWMPAQGGHPWSRDDVMTGLRGHLFDVIVCSPRRVSLASMRDIIATFGRAGLPPIALVDGEDYMTMHWELCEELLPAVYCKRELGALQHGRPTRVEPFSLCSAIPDRPPVDKDIDILFLCGNTAGVRGEICAALRSTFGDRFVGGLNVQTGYAEYLDHLARAKLAISVRGWGYDTLRYWEIPSFDTVLVSDRLPLVRPFPFQHGTTCLEFGNAEELTTAVRCALEDTAWREGIARAGNAHLRAHHTGAARARQLLSYCGVSP